MKEIKKFFTKPKSESLSFRDKPNTSSKYFSAYGFGSKTPKKSKKVENVTPNPPVVLNTLTSESGVDILTEDNKNLIV